MRNRPTCIAESKELQHRVHYVSNQRYLVIYGGEEQEQNPTEELIMHALRVIFVCYRYEF